MSEFRAYYAVIPAPVRYDETIPSNAKLLYGEITALCNIGGLCWAQNAYFADLYNVCKRTVQNWINALESKRYINVNYEYADDGKTILRRCISLPKEDCDVFTPSCKNFHGGSEKIFITPHEKKFHENIKKDGILKGNGREGISRPPVKTDMAVPSVAEVKAFCREKGYGVDAEGFVAYYESNGWRVGKNPMRDWRAAARSWEARDKREAREKREARKPKGQLEREYTEDDMKTFFSDIHNFDDLEV